MDLHPTSSDQGHSPPVSSELLLHGHRLNVASIGPHGIVLRNGRVIEAGSGVLRLTIGNHVTTYHVELPHGVDPARTEQPYQLSRQTDDAAA